MAVPSWLSCQNCDVNMQSHHYFLKLIPIIFNFRPMHWTKQHDILLLREVLAFDLYLLPKKERAEVWENIASNLNTSENPKFQVCGRSVRDRLQLTLIKNYKKKMADEINATGIEIGPPTEFDVAIEEIVEKYELSKIEEESRGEEKRAQELNERNQAMDIRRQALERVGETKKRKMADEDKPRRQRRQGHDTVAYLKQKSEQDMKIHEDEMLLKRDTQKFQETQHKEMMQQLISQQQQQQTMFQAFQQQQQQQLQQINQIQMGLMQQQQQQNESLMAVLKALVDKK